MRNIKFRAWDKKKNEWAFGYKKLGGFHLFGELHVLGYLQLDKLNDYVCMQYTGLKDKNGVEIYEGDRVERAADFGTAQYPYITKLVETVEYRGGAFYPVCEEPGINFKVIGNIYDKD